MPMLCVAHHDDPIALELVFWGSVLSVIAAVPFILGFAEIGIEKAKLSCISSHWQHIA